MKVLMFSPYVLMCSPHYETELEIAQNHLDAGDDVSMVVCNAHLSSCYVNLQHDIWRCLQCRSKRATGLKLISTPIALYPIYRLSSQDMQEIKSPKTAFTSIADLKNLRVDNFDVGYAVLSSLISRTREPNPDLSQHRGILMKNISSSLLVYKSMLKYLASFKFDRVYIFNGRFSHLRAAVRACEKVNVEFYTHDRGGRLDKYTVVKNTLPHDLTYLNNAIKEMWESSPSDDERVRVGSQFYIDRYRNISDSWVSFTKDQKKNLLPDDWDNTKSNISIFLSSEDEYEAIGKEWGNPLYEDQIDGITKIASSMSYDRQFHFYLRVHPNLRNVNNSQVAMINKMDFPNLTVIPADSEVSTYALMKNSSKVISFGSTMGIEAAYWGKPSILAGMCAYRELGSTYNPSSHEELISMIKADLEPKNKTGAIIYGYYFRERGIKYKYYKPSDFFTGTFKGKSIKEGILFQTAAIFLTLASPRNLFGYAKYPLWKLKLLIKKLVGK